MVTLSLSECECAILEDIEFVGHGTLREIACDKESKRDRTREVHNRYKNFFNTLQEEGKFDEVIVHGGLPAYAHIRTTTENGRDCTRKIKFK